MPRPAPATILPAPEGLVAPGAAEAAFVDVVGLDAVPAGTMTRISRGDLDVLVAHTAAGLVAVDDRCPHMAAPLSIGLLEGCLLACPLHQGRFDLSTGATERFPTTGGLDAEGGYHPPWIALGSPARPEPTDLKARARALTRIRRLRYYPLRVREGRIEVALPGS
ncbi:MAG: Rieske (2Fe-2S) protein [Candidatus Limnocylindrales bacterium]